MQYGGPLSSGVKVELVAWARDVANAERFDRAGDATKASALAERASGHQLKAIGIAEREAAALPPPLRSAHDALAAALSEETA